MRLDSEGWEKPTAALVVSWIVALHLWCFVSAGPLWRDESNSLLQARLPTWEMVRASLEFDSFPILHPAALRLWSALPAGTTDLSLRLLGLCTGLGVLASIWAAGRLVSGHVPLICLALIAADPVLISEGDSLRPYGISIFGLLWAFVFFARYTRQASALSLGGASIASVFSVQANYSNALFVGVFCVCSALAGIRSRSRRDNWKIFLPGLAAAFSLLPYGGLLHSSSSWISMLRSRVDWHSLLRRYLRDHSAVYLIIWLVFLLLAVLVAIKAYRNRQTQHALWSATTAYTISASAICAAVLVLVVQAAGIPPFPRYFLPGAILLALTLESLLRDWCLRLKVITVSAAVLCAGVPTWNWLGQRHTNMDRVAATLAKTAQPGDLIVISPWFLHTSFQRYYGGTVEWCTVPDIDRYPMMRYDLVRDAIIRGDSLQGVGRRIQAALDRGGAIWFIAQRAWVQLDRREAPEPPPKVEFPRGRDYASFRSYWERDVEFRLRACCRAVEADPPVNCRVWEEEDLILTRWSPAAQ